MKLTGDVAEGTQSRQSQFEQHVGVGILKSWDGLAVKFKHPICVRSDATLFWIVDFQNT